jgi:hypothetical protein
LSDAEKALIDRCITYPRGYDAPLLEAPAVRARLHESGLHAEWIGVEPRPHTVTLYDFVSREMTLYYEPSVRHAYADCRIAPALFGTLLPQLAALLIHAGAVVRNDKALLFLAPDGGGKSTVVLQPGVGLVLSDDHVLIRLDGPKTEVHGTPWGRVFDPGRAELGAIFLLEKGEDFAMSPVSGSETFHYLWGEHQAYGIYLPKALRKTQFDLYWSLSHAAPSFRTRFTRQGLDWRAVDQAVHGQ